MCSINTHRVQQGFSLIELLVGVAIGAVLISALTVFLIVSAARFESLLKAIFIQENARFAMMELRRNLRQAGVMANFQVGNYEWMVFDKNVCSDSESGLASGRRGSSPCNLEHLSNRDGIATDRLAVTVWLVGRPDEREQTIGGCNGVEVEVQPFKQRRVALVYWAGDIDGDGVRSLYCQAMDADLGLALGAAVPLVDGIVSLEVQFGADINVDGIVDRYLTFAQLSVLEEGFLLKAIDIRIAVNSGTLAFDPQRSRTSHASLQFNDQQQFIMKAATVAEKTSIYSLTIDLMNARR